MLNISQRVSSASLEAIVLGERCEGRRPGCEMHLGLYKWLVPVSGELTYIKLLVAGITGDI